MRVPTPPIIAHDGMDTTVAPQKVGEAATRHKRSAPSYDAGAGRSRPTRPMTDSRRPKITRLDFLAGRSR